MVFFDQKGNKSFLHTEIAMPHEEGGVTGSSIALRLFMALDKSSVFTFAYSSRVRLAVECPRRRCTTAGETPASSILTVKVLLREWMLTPLMPS